MDDQIGKLVSQLEEAVRVNQETIDRLKTQMGGREDTLDMNLDYEYTLEFMASYMRKIFKNYSDGLHHIKKTYDDFSTEEQKETDHWKKKYEQEHRKHNESKKLIEKIVNASQKEFDEYCNIISIYQTYTDNLVEHFNKD